MNQKPFELAAKQLVKRQLWSHGFSAKEVRFAPVDLVVGDHYVKVLYSNLKDKKLFIPEEAHYADVLAVVFQTVVGAEVRYLRLGLENTEKLVGKELRMKEISDLIYKDFIESPANLFTGYRKEKEIPVQEFTLLPDEWYSVTEIAQHKLLDKQCSKAEVRKLIDTKRLKAAQWGTGNGKRTLVKGEWIIQYLAEEGLDRK